MVLKKKKKNLGPCGSWSCAAWCCLMPWSSPVSPACSHWSALSPGSGCGWSLQTFSSDLCLLQPQLCWPGKHNYYIYCKSQWLLDLYLDNIASETHSQNLKGARYAKCSSIILVICCQKQTSKICKIEKTQTLMTAIIKGFTVIRIRKISMNPKFKLNFKNICILLLFIFYDTENCEIAI